MLWQHPRKPEQAPVEPSRLPVALHRTQQGLHWGAVVVPPPFAAELTSIPQTRRLAAAAPPAPSRQPTFLSAGPTSPTAPHTQPGAGNFSTQQGSGRAGAAAGSKEPQHRGSPNPAGGQPGPGWTPSVPPGPPPAPQCSPRSAPARWRPWPGLCPPRVLAAEWLQYGHRRARPAAGRGGTGRAGAGGNRGGRGEGPRGAAVEPPPPPHGHRRAPRGWGSGLGQAREGPEPPQRGPGPGRGASP